MTEPTATIYLDSGKVIGQVKDGVFRKSISSKKHFLQKPPAIAFDVVSIKDAEMYGAETIDVLDKDTGKHYTTSIKKLWEFGFLFDRGSGEQVALRLPYWKVS